MNNFFRTMGWLIVISMILVLLFIIVAPQFGWNFSIVPTESMKPTFNPGGIVVSRPARMDDIQAGDPILFLVQSMEKDALMCHRVIEIKRIDGELFFVTKGDANSHIDPWLVSSHYFVGKTIYYIPSIGKMAYQARLHHAPITIFGKPVTITILIILAIGFYLIGGELKNIWDWTSNPNLKRRREREEKRKERITRRRTVRSLKRKIFS